MSKPLPFLALSSSRSTTRRRISTAFLRRASGLCASRRPSSRRLATRTWRRSRSRCVGRAGPTGSGSTRRGWEMTPVARCQVSGHGLSQAGSSPRLPLLGGGARRRRRRVTVSRAPGEELSAGPGRGTAREPSPPPAESGRRAGRAPRHTVSRVGRAPLRQDHLGGQRCVLALVRSGRQPDLFRVDASRSSVRRVPVPVLGIEGALFRGSFPHIEFPSGESSRRADATSEMENVIVNERLSHGEIVASIDRYRDPVPIVRQGDCSGCRALPGNHWVPARARKGPTT